MNRIFSALIAGFIICTLVWCMAGEETVSALFNGLAGTAEAAGISGKAASENNGTKKTGVPIIMQITVNANGKTTVFELNNSRAARDLYAQLPLSITVENYSSNEKIFYPPEKLGTADTPKADAQAGTLAYYAPWGNVVMFYGHFGSAAGLYALGHAVSGTEFIQEMSGTIRIEKVIPQKNS